MRLESVCLFCRSFSNICRSLLTYFTHLKSSMSHGTCVPVVSRSLLQASLWNLNVSFDVTFYGLFLQSLFADLSLVQ